MIGSGEHDEVAEICRDLIRIDSSNWGDGSGQGERAAAEYVAGELAECGVQATILESAPKRANVLARITGTDPTLPALLVHGHLDVVPAVEDGWRFPPFSGEIADDCVWGRGAVDMKDMDAMILAVVRRWARDGVRPRRDIVLAFLADEEAGGRHGSHWLVDHHPEQFEGCAEAISEVGGFSVTLANEARLYLVETAQKGLAWLRLTARGPAGHGSMTNDGNAVAALVDALGRLTAHQWPVRLTPTVRRLLDGVADTLGLDPATPPDDIVRHLGPLARMVGATLRNTAAPTMLDAGYKVNVVPAAATAHVDGRFLPGHEEEFMATVDRLLGPGIERETVHHDIALETGFSGDLVSAMVSALRAEDPEAGVLPYCLSGGTDNKAFARLGIRGYGFVPLRLPPDLDFSGMFHGVNERVPLAALRFGARVLDRLLVAY
ncbi:M20/M25/M40 family metallo-hydrolase [Sphaerimonospora mesophila]|uniref:M20/M25/M40 family metallo-hydrolase n=1 Tax=Sphaerimonospora mesophila TaxID=37483 RepID=UPI0006E3F29A